MSAEYDLVAQQYDVTFQCLPYRIYIEEWSVLGALGDVAGCSVLELACGTGHYSRRLRQRNAKRVVGVDLSPDMIAVAQDLERKQPLGITYHVHDAATLDLGETFDRVLAVYLLHYAADRQQLSAMAAVIARHLRPGGRLLTYQLNPDIARDASYYEHYGLRVDIPAQVSEGQRISFTAKLGDVWSPPITAYYWSRATLTEALEQAGLIEVRWQSPTLNPRGVEPHGAAHWRAYLEKPHCMLIEAAKP